MATSPLAFIVDTLIGVLDDDNTLELVRVWNPTSPATTDGNTVVYPYVNNITYDGNPENGGSLLIGTAQCEVMCRQHVVNDASKTGLATIEAGLIARKVHKLLYDFDPESLATNNDTVFTTRIVAVQCNGNVGHFDNNDSKIEMGLAVTVHFIQTRN